MRSSRRSLSDSVVSEWLIAIAAAVIAFLIQRQPPQFADPIACPGLLEWMAITASRSSSRVTMASILAWMNLVLVPLSVGALSLMIQRAGGPAMARAAASVAAAVTVVAAPTLAPSSVMAIGAASVALLACVRTPHTTPVSGRRLAGAVFAMTAGIAPALAVPLAFVAAWICLQSTDSRRVVAAALTVAIVVGLPAVLLLTFPSLPGEVIKAGSVGCLVPHGFSAGAVAGAARHAFGTSGPVPMALALLGAFTSRALVARRDAWPAMGLAVLPLLATGWSSSASLRTLAPTIAAFWWLVAVGLRDVVGALTTRRAWRAGAWSIAFLLPVLQWTHRSSVPIDPADLPRGDDALSRRHVSQLFGALPSGSTIVIDDAASDLLLRSSATAAQHSGKVFRFVSREGREALAAGMNGMIFTMPRAQRRLQHQGVRRAAANTGIPSVVAFTVAAQCTTIGSQWLEADNVSLSSAVAVAADRPGARGPVVMYLGADVAMSPRPIDWPEWTVRGYFVDSYDRSRDADRQRLDLHRREDVAPPDHRVFGFPFIVRLELWRVPDGPSVLPVELGQPPAVAIVRAVTPGDADGLRLCPSFAEK
jgi:hypothetical protein